MIQTKYGNLNGEFACQYYEDGRIKSCKLESENILETEYGTLIPQYETLESRTRDRNSLEFFKDGGLKSAYLNQFCKIKTPIGELQGEFITFYESGGIHRFFPSYGKVGGTWSEEEEKAVAPNIKLEVNGIHLDNKLSTLCFYESGFVKSITLYPGEQISVPVQNHMMKVRFGVAFYETGKIKSVEPALVSPIRTPIGNIFAYDNFANGISGDQNSLVFYENGEVHQLVTVISGITITDKKSGEKSLVQALRKPSRLDIEQWEMYPIRLVFTQEGLEITDSDENKSFYEKENYEFSSYYNMLYNMNEEAGACSSDCSKCNGCS